MKIRHLYMEDSSINPDLWSKKIIIWGAGNDGIKLYSKLKGIQKEISFFCDSNESLYAEGVLGVPVLSYQQLDKYEDHNLALAFHQYPEVLEKIPEKMKDNIFADFMFEHSGSGTCIICGYHKFTYDNAHFAPFLKERMYLGQDKKTRIMHCLHCGIYYSEYRPDEEEMERLYNKYRDETYNSQRKKYESNYSSSIYYERKTVERRKNNVEKFVMPYLQERRINNLLDYGGDKGQFIPDIFFHTNRYVYDISQNETISGVTLLNSMQEVQEIEWDIILCMMLLEHVSSPMLIINELVNLMQETTLLYIELPYQDYMRQYSDVEINEHINFFRESTMVEIGKVFHLEIVKIETDNGGCMRILYKK